jgi:hypothetical protein
MNTNLTAELALTARSHSLLSPERLAHLWTQVKSSPPTGDTLEIGCWRGGSSLIMARATTETRPLSHTWICDTFQGLVDADPNWDNQHANGDFGQSHPDWPGDIPSPEAMQTHVHDLLGANGCRNYTVLRGYFPTVLEAQIPADTLFSTVHIDVDTYASYLATLNWLIQPSIRLTPGARIILDDYGMPSCRGATTAVDRWLAWVAPRGHFRIHHQNPPYATWLEYTPPVD